MKQEQIKTYVMNAVIVVVILGILLSIYFIFIKKDSTISNTVASVASVAKIAEQTAIMGTQIDSTVKDLGDLASAVASSKEVFDLPSFKNLQDFSVTVPAQNVGRPNPFVPTTWKQSIDALQSAAASASASSNTGSSGTASSASASSVPPATPVPPALSSNGPLQPAPVPVSGI